MKGKRVEQLINKDELSNEDTVRAFQQQLPQVDQSPFKPPHSAPGIHRLPPTAIQDVMETQEQHDPGSQQDTQNSQFMPQIQPSKIKF